MKKRIKLLFACVLAICLVAVLGGCSSEEASGIPELSPASVSTPTIGEDGVLRVGVDTSKAPLAGIVESTQTIVGLDVDVAAAIADELGLELALVDVGTDAQSAIDSGDVDIVMGINDADAADTYWLSSSYLPTAVVLFSLTDGAAVPVEGDGSTFAAQVSSTSAWAVSNEFGANSLTTTSSLNDAFQELNNGSVNFVAADAIIGYYAAHTLDMQVYITALLTQLSGYSIAVSSGNVDLQTTINNVVADITSNGVVDYIERKWLGVTLDLASVPTTAGASTTNLEEGDLESDDEVISEEVIPGEDITFATTDDIDTTAEDTATEDEDTDYYTDEDTAYDTDEDTDETG